MEFRILGPLEVTGDEGAMPVPLGGRKQRALLAYLLLHANEVVSTGRLLDEIWGERVGLAEAHLLYPHVSRVRALLATQDTETTLLKEKSGYRLRVDPERLDLTHFQRLAKEGRAALAAGDHTRAQAALTQALSLWRGEPLTDLEGEPFVREATQRLNELHVEVLTDRIEAELVLGRHLEVLAELEQLVQDHAYRERLWGQLALALYRSERQADALDVCRRARRLLADELGLEPGPELRALENAILHHDPALSRPRPLPEPRRRWVPAAIAAAAVAAAAALGVLLLQARGGPGTKSIIVPDSLVAIDAATGKPLANVRLPGGPERIAAGGGAIWASRRDSGTLAAVDARTRILVGLVDTRLDRIDGLAAGPDGAWALGPRRARSRKRHLRRHGRATDTTARSPLGERQCLRRPSSRGRHRISRRLGHNHPGA